MVGDGEQEEEGGLRFSVENWAEGDRVPSELCFTVQLGPTIAIESKMPVEYFDLFVTEDDYKATAEETN